MLRCTCTIWKPRRRPIRIIAKPSARWPILERGPLAARARAGLEASKNVWVLGNAAYMLQSQYNKQAQMGTPDPRAAALAERYFLLALALDPKLDRKAILPQIDLQAIAKARRVSEQDGRAFEARAEAGVAKLRRLPVEAFRDLPRAIAGVLRARRCTIPQPERTGAPRNVIRGEFFARGQAGWAVLCSVNNSSTLLAFRNDNDTNPAAIDTSEDRSYVQELAGGEFGYSHAITAVGREYILRNYRAIGGPEPPPLDRQGIDDAFLGKASHTWYFYQGTWVRLTGAD